MKEKLENIIEEYVDNYEQKPDIKSSWRSPLTAYADSNDQLFKKLKEIVSENHALPEDLLTDARTVISFFLPFDKSINKSNIDGQLSSRDWAIAYIETNRLIYELNKEIKEFLAKQGYQSTVIQATHNFDEKKLISDWSHRHAAYIAGLGTFGINNMLITEKGCAGRVGSIVTDLKLEPTERDNKEHCLYKYNDSCKVCITRCVNGSLQEDSFNRYTCYDLCLKNAEHHNDLDVADVCGKCCVDLPCTITNPVS